MLGSNVRLKIVFIFAGNAILLYSANRVYCLVPSGRGFFKGNQKRSIWSCDLKFPNFPVTQPQQCWLEGVKGGWSGIAMICTFSLSSGYIRKQTFGWVWLHLRGFFITFLSLWRDHKICPSLCSFGKKKFHFFTCKTKGVREAEGERRGWSWHVFSAVIMDPSHRMICSYTWLTELSSVNKHSNTSSGRDTNGRFPLFSELRLDCAASLTWLRLYSLPFFFFFFL